MRKSWFVIGAIGAVGPIGCASWHQPAPMTTETRAASESAPPVLVVQPSRSHPTEPPASPQQTIQVAGYVENVEKSSEALAADPAPDRLTLVAESLERGDKLAASRHLEAYVRDHPEEVMFRLQLIELLLQTKSDARAKVQLEQFVSRTQAAPEAVRKYLVHAHTRLMEIAQRSEDSFGEEFHRGVGLLILVQEQDNNPTRDDGFCEEMLCRSLRALNAARDQKPDDSRVHAYLAEVYIRMGNRRAAAQERTAAQNSFVLGQLTPVEREKVVVP